MGKGKDLERMAIWERASLGRETQERDSKGIRREIGKEAKEIRKDLEAKVIGKEKEDSKGMEKERGKGLG